jgi:hypothetical protein
MEVTMKFKELKIGQEFDFVNDSLPGYNSFFDTCRKISARKYISVGTGIEYQVGSISALVYHVID